MVHDAVTLRGKNANPLLKINSTPKHVYCFLYVHMTVHRNKFLCNKTTRCINFTNLFWHETVHVSDSSSVNHQEFIPCTLTNVICHTGL